MVFLAFFVLRLLALKASKKHRNRVLAENTVFLRLDLASCGRGRGPLGPPGAPPETQKSHFSKTSCFTGFLKITFFVSFCCPSRSRQAQDAKIGKNIVFLRSDLAPPGPRDPPKRVAWRRKWPPSQAKFSGACRLGAIFVHCRPSWA